jgi:HAD superfamily hydrolase (TIGR01549 family)
MTPSGRDLVDHRTLDWVTLDVGETIVDETRAWRVWAELLAVPFLTLGAALGAVIDRDDVHQSAFDLVDRADWRSWIAEFEVRYGGFRHEDLYPDALRAIAGLKAAGLRVAVAGNQPAPRTAELRRLGIDTELVVMSDELGLAKPDPAFYRRLLELLGDPEPERVAYVGDRVDNDVLPAQAAGLRAVWLRRGPWGVIQSLPEPSAADLVVGSLDELVRRLAGPAHD